MDRSGTRPARPDPLREVVGSRCGCEASGAPRTRPP
ncbi:MAG TPA: hypothetical protein ENI85_16770 [Deltaproteobacteria bacterium]|nr:hypothetical protein [Deltaproteobacteria bacterium]